MTITICSVSYRHGQVLAWNHRLLCELNRNSRTKYRWLVANNDAADPLDNLRDLPNLTIVPGSDERALGPSNHHAVALNQLLRMADTRFVLVLDPDFYLLVPEWLDRIPDHLQRRGLQFFGAPWHPRYTPNYRYFPAVHCMWIDTAKVPTGELDFRPILDDQLRLPLGLGDHGRLQRSWDTGTRVYRRFGRAKDVRSECALQVFRPERDPTVKPAIVSARNRMVEALLPDAMCYMPKRRASFTRIGFAERGWIPMALPPLWEETVWNDRPFGLHVRRSFGAAKRDSAAELDLLRTVLDSLTAAVSGAAVAAG